MAEPREPSESGDSQEIRGPDGRFLPGASGNPAGMPKGIVQLRTIIKRQLAEVDPETRKQVAEKVIESAIKHEIDGNAAYLKIVMDSNDGPLPETLNVTISGIAIEEMSEEQLDAEIERRSRNRG